MERMCDNQSVGVIISNNHGEIALLERGRYPWGFAPPSGHIDEHGSALYAAVNEVREEVGLQVRMQDLSITPIFGLPVANRCRRQGGDHHVWWVFRTSEFQGQLAGNVQETKQVTWADAIGLRALADRTKAYRAGRISRPEWQSRPGIEPVWADFLSELGYIK
jgi:8-oxo-dGTP pyrophosphatase MutT (NUDIX family)